ncbi:MAG: C10 family peptidase, partial [Bacteroidales bacterium]
KYNWNNIYQYPRSNADFDFFIKDVRNLCGVKYDGANGTSSTITKAQKAFTNLGYNATIKEGTCFATIRNEIKGNRPIYIRGEDSNSGHAWICEGYQHQKYKATISMIIDPKYGEPNPNSKYFDYNLFINPTSDKEDNSTREYYYMNFGWGGFNDGWYHSNGYSVNSKYTKNQEMLIVNKNK